MMELDITNFYDNAYPKDYSASVLELGQDAGLYTWQSAKNDSEDYMMLDTEEKRIAMRQYVRTFGAWDDEEIATWTDLELNALLIQMISGDIRESVLENDPDNWIDYEIESEKGQVSGRLFPTEDGKIYYYIGE